MRGCATLLLLVASLAAANPVTQYVTLSPVHSVTVAAGKPQKVMLTFHVLPRYHINSNKPHTEFLIPTRLKLEPPTDLGVGAIAYPAGADISLSFAPDDKLSVYTGTVPITASVSAVPSAVPGTYRMRGELMYQACDDSACYPPRKLPVEFDVRVTKSRIHPASETVPHSKNPPQSPHVHR